jgi:hypothetical protein
MPRRKSKPQAAITRTGQWRQKFLTALAAGGNVSYAADAAGIDRNTAYAARKKDSQFAEAWTDAIDRAADVLEEEARRRAVEGLPRFKFHQGEPIINPETKLPYVEREYSDTLLIFLLKGARPHKFRENINVQGQVSITVPAVVVEGVPPQHAARMALPDAPSSNGNNPN